MIESIQDFARTNRLETVKGADGVVTILGKTGAIYPFSPDRLACHFQVQSQRACNARVRNCQSVGMTLVQDGDLEAVLAFDPASEQQLACAVIVAGIRRKRTPSEAQLRALAAGRRR